MWAEKMRSVLRMKSPIGSRSLLVFLPRGYRYYADVPASIIWPICRRLEAQRNLLTYARALVLLADGAFSIGPQRGKSPSLPAYYGNRAIHITDSQLIDSFPNGEIARASV